MKMHYFLLFLSSIVVADSIGLEKMLEETKKQHPLHLALQQEKLSLEAQSKAASANKPIELSASMAQASPDEGDKALEYSVGLSKSFSLGKNQERTLKAHRLRDKISIIEREKSLLALRNQLQNLYHQSCLSRENKKLFSSLLKSYEKLYDKKRKAFKYHDISKKELLQLQIELQTLKQEVQSNLSKEVRIKESLFKLSNVTPQTLSCDDLSPLKADITLSDDAFSLSNGAFNHTLSRLEILKQNADTQVDNIDIGLTFDDEIDTKRVGVGFAMPLHFTSDKKEQTTIGIMHKMREKKLEYQHTLQEKKNRQKSLESTLNNLYKRFVMIEKNHTLYKNALMPLIEKSYQLGESSALEYILGRQKLLTLSQTLIETKKRYYETLFTLYTLTEMEP